MAFRGVFVLVLLAALAACEGLTGSVMSVSINQTDQTLTLGDSVQLTATVIVVGEVSRGVAWTPSDSSIASVSATGLVQAVGVGVATITSTSVTDASKSDTITITVTDPDDGEPDDGEPDTVGPTVPTIDGLRFDFSGAIGVQMGRGGIAVASGTGSNLIKVLSDGQLEDALIEGSVRVRDFFLRNGKLYALFERDEYWEYDPETGEERWVSGIACVLGEIDSDGAVICIDPDVYEVEVSSIQFDALGGIYYRGYTHDWRTVIRRYAGGTTRDYYVADDATQVHQFLVTRDGRILASGYSSGGVSGTHWLRLLGDPTTGTAGRDLSLTTNIAHYIYGFLPDGTILAESSEEDSVHAYPNPRRIFPDPRFHWDDRSYVGSMASSRFGFDMWRFRQAFERRYLSSEAVFGVTVEGVLMMYPEVRYLDLPVNRVNNAELKANLAVISGTEGTARRALLVDLMDESYIDMLKGANLDVLRILMELDRERVLLYAIDIARNQPVLAQYDIRRDVLEMVDVTERLADSFVVLDWRVEHVPPESVPWTPEPTFSWEQSSGWDAAQVSFSMADPGRQAFLDRFLWDFGDGEARELDWEGNTCSWEAEEGTGNWIQVCSIAGMQTSHAFTEPGSYTVTLSVTNDFGQTGTTTATITVVFDAPTPTFTAEPLSGWDLGNVTFDASDTPDLAYITAVHWDYGDGNTHETEPGSETCTDEYNEERGYWETICQPAGIHITHAYVEPGDYLVTLTMTNFLGISASTTEAITVVFDAPTPTFTAEPLSGWDLGNVTFDASDTPDLAYITAVHWDYGDGNTHEAISTGESCYDEYNHERGYWETVCRPISITEETCSEEYSDERGYQWVCRSNIHLTHAYVEPGDYLVTLTMTNFLGVSASETASVTVEVLELAGVAAARERSVAWTVDGRVFATGAWPDRGDWKDRFQWLPVTPTAGWAEPVKKISLGEGGHALAVTEAGRVYGWGLNDNGQVGDGTRNTATTPVEIVVAPDVIVVDVSAGENHSIAVTADGELYAWGGNGCYQLGIGSELGTVNQFKPVLVTVDVEPSPVFVRAEASNSFTLGLTDDGRVFSWGCSSLGRTGDSSRPGEVPIDGVVVDLAAGAAHRLVLTSTGKVLGWGANGDGQTGTDSVENDVSVPTKVATEATVVQVAAGSNHSFAVTVEGDLLGWGSNAYGRLGVPGLDRSFVPVPVTIEGGLAVRRVAAATDHSLALDTEGQLQATGANWSGQLGSESSSAHAKFFVVR